MLPRSLTVVHLKRSYPQIFLFFCDNLVPGSPVGSGPGFRGVTKDLQLRSYCLADLPDSTSSDLANGQRTHCLAMADRQPTHWSHGLNDISF